MNPAAGETSSVERTLAGQIALITGGSGGIGLGIARSLAEAGAAVVIWARNAAKNAAAVDGLQRLGATAVAFEVDATDARRVDEAMAEVVGDIGVPTIVFANAAITGASVPFVDLAIDDWHHVLRNNLDATMLPLQAGVRAMVAADRPGALVTVSSIVTSFGAPGNAAYAASKASATALAMSLAVELAPHRIRSNVLRPGWTDTDMLAADGAYGGAAHERFRANTIKRTPVRRWATPADLGPAAVFLADPRHEFHTGDVVTVDGGYCIS